MGATTLSIATFGITTLIKTIKNVILVSRAITKFSIATLSIQCLYAECCIAIVYIKVVMLIVVA